MTSTITAVAIVVGLLAQGKTTKPEAESTQVSKFRSGLQDAANLFRDARGIVREVLIAPAQRDQASRYLHRLSTSLEILALQKGDFAREVASAKFDKDNPDLVDAAQSVRNAIWNVQRLLVDVFGTFPDRFRTSAAAAREKLDLGLNSKLESLERVAGFLGISTNNRELILAELKKDMADARSLRAEVDKLLAELDAMK